MLPVRQIARQFLPRRAPAPAGGMAAPMDRCLLLAVLLHVWLIVLIGNAPGGTAKPGEGVYGSISVRLTGPGSADGANDGSAAPRPDLGPPGGASRQRFGGVVRQEDDAPSEQAGAARLGQWAPQVSELQRLKAAGETKISPTPAAAAIEPLPLPNAQAATAPDQPEAPEAPRLARLPEPTPTAAAALTPMAPAPRPEASISTLPPLSLPLDSRQPNTSVSRSATAPLQTLPAPSNAALPTVAALPALSLPLSSTATVVSRPATSQLSAAPALPSAAELPPAPQLSLPMAQLAAPNTSITRVAPASAMAALAAASAVSLDALRPLPSPALPLSALAAPSGSISKAPAVQPLSPLSAQPRPPELAPLPATVLPLRASSESLNKNSLSGAPALSKLPELATAGSRLEPLPATASTSASTAAAAPSPSASPSSTAPSAATADAPAQGTPSNNSERANATAAAKPAGNNTASALSGQSPAGQSGAPTSGQRVDLNGRSVASDGAPDAGSQQGHDIATPPSAAASAPKLNLSLPLRGGPLANRRSSGLLDLLAQPPEVKSKLQKSVEEAAREDCRKAYAEKGLLAALPLGADAARDKGCRW